MSCKLSVSARQAIAQAVSEAGGAEVFFGARVDPEGLIAEVEVLARGDEEEVPAVLRDLDSWDLVIHNHPDGDVRPSKADLAVACEVASAGKGFAVCDNTASSLYVVVEPAPPKEVVKVRPEVVEEFFGPQGPLAQVLPDYEPRADQVCMALEVLRAFNESRILAVEAGTGSGKSFAYLVPGIFYALANRTRIVVATGTINLQEQLVGKDLPVLEKAFEKLEGGRSFTFAHLKGRGNYLCRRRADELREKADQAAALCESEKQQSELSSVLAWAAETDTGSLSDMPFTPSPDVWDHVVSDPDRCLNVRCPCFKKCFYFKARIQAVHATVLVANHHLFFADLAVRMQTGNFTGTVVLPPWRYVIFDEAHDLEDAASSFFGVALSNNGVERRFSRLWSSGKRGEKGLVVSLIGRLLEAGEAVFAVELQTQLSSALREAREACARLFQCVAQEAERGGTESVRSLRYRGEEDAWEAIFEQAQAAADTLREAGLHVRGICDRLEEKAEEEDKYQRVYVEAAGILGRLVRLEDALRTFADRDDKTSVRWVEVREGRGGKVVHLRAAPLSVAPLFKEALWESGGAFVLTSATLTVGGRIDFFAKRVGLDGFGSERFIFKTFPGPFRWKEQALLVVPTDLPDVTEETFPEESAQWIARATKISRGRAFVLFTSYSMLRKAYRTTFGVLSQEGLKPLCQGELPRSRLLQEFKVSGRAVLFGTDSFWQGVDVRGEALSLVIIARLPFAVPTEPLQVARMEDIEARGGDPFRELSLPQAVLKLRQGVGRLIRSRRDKGVVAILDRRIVTKWYGKLFAASLPPMRSAIGDSKELFEELENFFNQD